jgi:type VI protein secretion system component VasK
MKPVTGAMFEVTIDGQTTDSSGTGSLKGTFPAPSGAQTGVVMKLASTAGPAAAPPANAAPAAPSGGNSSLIKNGIWGLFRFVDAGKPQKQGSGEYALTYSLGGKTISATVKSSGGDLFDKSVFRNAKAPQNLFK